MHRLVSYRKVLALGLVMLVLLLPILACTGPQGTAGSQGPAGPQGATGPAAAGGAAAIIVTPLEATVGGKFNLTIYGSGWPEGERGVVWVVGLDGGEDHPLRAFKADERGAWTGKTGGRNTVPKDAKPGIYTVKAAGDNTGIVVTYPLAIVEKK